MKHQQTGGAIVEFALIMPLLLILVFITTEFGRAMYQYNTLAKSVRDAVRYLSTQSPWLPDYATTESATRIAKINAVKATARNLAVFGNPAGTGNPLALGLSVSNVPLTDSGTERVWQLAGADPQINTVTVSITGYTFTPIIASAFGVNFSNITFADIRASMRGAL